MKIQVVTVELLRAGPRHNQLLSPLTRYLGVSGENPAGVVQVPWEHAEFTRIQRGLNDEAIESRERQQTMNLTGRELARVLGGVPGLEGAVGPDTSRVGLLNLRILMSASELAQLPFELAHAPTASEETSSSWLAFQAGGGVCITRRIRSVSSSEDGWPTAPRILFISGHDVPFEAHRSALEEALEPWGSGEDRLVILEGGTLADVVAECAAAAEEGSPFTHVHVLAHGAGASDQGCDPPKVLEIGGGEVSGEALASALTVKTEDGYRLPTVVTLASCGGGEVSNVIDPGASIAHELHERGVVLVVASQYLLSKEGSIPFVQHFYEGQLWGEHPIASLYEVRRRLHSLHGARFHDWASLVAYEALPEDLEPLLERQRYWQARGAQSHALAFLESEVRGYATDGIPLADFESAAARVDRRSAKLPQSGTYMAEVHGLRAAADKRIGEAALELAVQKHIPAAARDRLLAICSHRMTEARGKYLAAARVLMAANGEGAQEKASIHWLLGQVNTLDTFLGRAPDPDLMATCRLAATMDTESANPVYAAWGHVSLAELGLLELDALGNDGEDLEGKRAAVAAEVMRHVNRVVALLGRSSEQAHTTSRQFRRYYDVWGGKRFAEALRLLGVPERAHWDLELAHGILQTAKAAADELDPPNALDDEERGRIRSRSGRPRSGRPGGRRVTRSGRPGSLRPGSAAGARARTELDRSLRMSVEMLPARNGDCLWIEYGDDRGSHRFLIDCGAVSAAELVKEKVAELPAEERELELFVLTHIDSDHIAGVQTLFEDVPPGMQFQDIWFNGWSQLRGFLSVRQAEKFQKILDPQKQGLPWNRARGTDVQGHPLPIVVVDGAPFPSYVLPGGMRLTVLGPSEKRLGAMGRDWKKALEESERSTEEYLSRSERPPKSLDAFDVDAIAKRRPKIDDSVPNGSSISLLAEFGGRSVLFLGDAYAPDTVAAIKELQRQRGFAPGETLQLDALKLSHHGSDSGTTRPLLEAIDCSRYLVSTDGSRFGHPDHAAIARVIRYGGKDPVLHFNYKTERNAFWGESALKEKWGYRTRYSRRKAGGLEVKL